MYFEGNKHICLINAEFEKMFGYLQTSV
jgi:hypothetical protein